MNADAFRHYYDYHFAENRKIWFFALQLTPQQFTQDIPYSIGSVRNQIVHLINVDNAWFSQLRGLDSMDELDASQSDTDKIRAHWDTVIEIQRAYLANLRDDMLLQKPFPDGEDKDLILWQVLLHVVNHGTDHRAQILRLISDFNLKTPPQDYVFYAYENPVPAGK